MEHQFFNGLPWDAVERRELNPPFKAALGSANDTRMFDKYYLTQPVEESFSKASSGGSDSNKGVEFPAFEYNRAKHKKSIQSI